MWSSKLEHEDKIKRRDIRSKWMPCRCMRRNDCSAGGEKQGSEGT